MKKETYKKAAAIARELELLNNFQDGLKSEEVGTIMVAKKDCPDLFKQLHESALKLTAANITKLNKDMEAL